MKTRTTLLLLAVLLVLGAVAVFVQGPARRDRPPDKAALLPGLQAKEVQIVRLGKDAGAVVLTRDGARWVVGAERFPADAAAVEKLLAGLAEIKGASAVSTNPAKQAGYEVDEEKGLPLRLEAAGGKPVAELIIGKGGPDFTSCYLRRRGEDKVFLAAMDLRGVVSRPVSGWRDRAIVPFARDEITAVQVRIGGATLALARTAKDGTWQVNGRAAARESVEGHVDLIAGLRAVDFAAPAEEARAGFDWPVAVIALEAGTKKAVLTLGAKKEGASQSYLRRDGSPAIFLVSQYVAEALLKKDTDFPPPAPEKK